MEFKHALEINTCNWIELKEHQKLPPINYKNKNKVEKAAIHFL